jgi:hypothetical protein
MPNSDIFASPYALQRVAKRFLRLLGMAGTDPSKVLPDLGSIPESVTAEGRCSRLAQGANRHTRRRNHLALVAGRHQDDSAAGGSLSAERINRCMLLLFVICVALAGSIVGAVAYLVHG